MAAFRQIVEQESLTDERRADERTATRVGGLHRCSLRLQRSAARALAVIVLLPFGACAFDPLISAPEPPPEMSERLEDSVIVDGFEIVPSIIHPGDEVLIVDPRLTPPPAAAPIYFWGACAGSVTQPTGPGREALWTAPDTPGIYAVTVNVTNTTRETTSTVIELCVASEGQESCTAGEGRAPELIGIVPERYEVNQARDCAGGGCAIDVTCEAGHPDGAELRYRWQVRRGTVEGEGPTIRWHMPEVGCCAEEYAIAVTVCDSQARAVTGYVDVRITPD